MGKGGGGGGGGEGRGREGRRGRGGGGGEGEGEEGGTREELKITGGHRTNSGQNCFLTSQICYLSGHKLTVNH